MFSLSKYGYRTNMIWFNMQKKHQPEVSKVRKNTSQKWVKTPARSE